MPILYFGGILVMIGTIIRRAEWGLFLIVVLLPQPNIFYKLYIFPFGKDFIDLLFFSILLGIFLNKNGFTKTGNTIMIFLAIVVSYFSLWNSSFNFSLPMPITTDNPFVKPWKNYAIMLLMYFITLNAIKDEEKRQEVLVVIMCLVVLFISFRSYRSYSAGPSFIEESRSQGPFWIVGLGSNYFGAFIVHYSSVFLGLLLIDRQKWRRILFLITILLGLHPLFFSYSRGAYLAAFGVLIFFGITKKRSLLILVFIILLGWNTILPTSVVERISMTRTEEGELESSASARLNLWEVAINEFTKNPIFGIGLGGYMLIVPEEMIFKDTHNIYLKVLCEQGIIGLAVLLIIFYRAIGSGLRLYKIGKSPFLQGLGLGFAGCVIACMLTNTFGDRWSNLIMGGYFWVFWGLVDRGILNSEKANKSVKNDLD